MSEKPVSNVVGIPVNVPVERAQLVAYLEYAVEEVAAFSDMSALLLRMAIAELRNTPAAEANSEPVHKYS
jgi:hypothetical protein